jgi:hypothetical protein
VGIEKAVAMVCFKEGAEEKPFSIAILEALDVIK